MIAIGIDPGVETGFAAWNAETKKLFECTTLMIHQAMSEVMRLARLYPESTIVMFEDARLRRWYGNADSRQAMYGASVREGVGSVKRDSKIWEDFLADKAIPHAAKHPGATKWKAEQFRKVTGWQGRTSEHARDAGLLVYGLPLPGIQAIRITWLRDHANTPTSSPARRISAR